MPFNIELMNKAGNTREIAIKLQVVNDRINIYFNGNKDEVRTVRENWEHLSDPFVATLPDFGAKESVLIADGIYHLKQAHTNILERTYVHIHLPFLREITPKLFARYLRGMYEQQKTHSGAQYQFFQGMHEIENIIEVFTVHYDLYKGSSMEREYNECSQLTPEEHIEHEKAANALKAEMTKPASNSVMDVEKLLITAFLSQGHPIFGNAPQHQRVIQELIIADMESLDCSIM